MEGIQILCNVSRWTNGRNEIPAHVLLDFVVPIFARLDAVSRLAGAFLIYSVLFFCRRHCKLTIDSLQHRHTNHRKTLVRQKKTEGHHVYV